MPWRVPGVQPIRKSYVGGILPGIYGSAGGALIGRERRWYEQFLADGKRQGRYQSLPPLHPNPQYPRLDSPIRLGRLLNQKNFLGLAPKILEHPLLKGYGYAFLSAAECGNAVDFIPARSRSKFTETFPNISARMGTLLQARFEMLLARRSIYLDSEPRSKDLFKTLAPGKDPASESLAYLVTNLLPQKDPLAAEIWQTALEGEDGYGGLGNLGEALYPIVLTKSGDMELLRAHERIASTRRNPWDRFTLPASGRWSKNNICAELKAKSLAALDGSN